MSRRRKIGNDEILSASRRLLLQQGLGVTTRVIAGELRISEGVLFQRYASKEELVRAALSAPRCDASRVLSESRKGDMPGPYLENIAIAVFASLRQALPYYIPRISMPNFDEENVFTSRSSPFSLFVAALEEHLIAERHAGRIRIDSPHATAYLIVSILHNAALFDTLEGASSATSEGAVRDLIGILWNGLETRVPVPELNPSRLAIGS